MVYYLPQLLMILLALLPYRGFLPVVRGKRSHAYSVFSGEVARVIDSSELERGLCLSVHSPALLTSERIWRYNFLLFLRVLDF